MFKTLHSSAIYTLLNEVFLIQCVRNGKAVGKERFWLHLHWITDTFVIRLQPVLYRDYGRLFPGFDPRDIIKI